jgi:hypothetical protein
MKLRPITGLTLRRAVFGTLFRAGRPMTAVEVVAALHAAGVTTSPMLVKPPALVIADMLAHQVRAGRVRRTSRGHYAVIAASMSRSTQWRCLHWRDRLEGA